LQVVHRPRGAQRLGAARFLFGCFVRAVEALLLGVGGSERRRNR
jgi:hypothetical protein